MLEAQITRAQSHCDASHTRYDAIESAMNDYSLAAFEAAKTAAKAYRDAAIQELLDNAETEKDLKEKEKDYYNGIAFDGRDELDLVLVPIEPGGDLSGTDPTLVAPTDLQNAIDAFASWQAAMTTAANAASATYATVNGQKSQRKNAMNNALKAAETANENIRKETDKQTERDYTNGENSLWNEYYAAILAAEIAYCDSIKQTEDTFRETKIEQDDAYKSTVIPACIDYYNQLNDLESLFNAAIAHAGDANFNVGDWFAGGNQGDYLFVAFQYGDDEFYDPEQEIDDLIQEALESKGLYSIYRSCCHIRTY